MAEQAIKILEKIFGDHEETMIEVRLELVFDHSLHRHNVPCSATITCKRAYRNRATNALNIILT